MIDAAAASHTGADVYMSMTMIRFMEFYKAIQDLFARRK